MLHAVLATPTGPVSIRYSKGAAPVTSNGQDARCPSGATLNPQLRLCAVGDQVAKAMAVKELLAKEGVAAEVVPVREVKPVSANVAVRQAGELVVSLENGVVMGGFGESIGADMRFGWPDAVVGHGPVEALEREFGFDAATVARAILERIGVKHG